jgi:hypothetical protein
MAATVIRMARWYLITSAIATALLVSAGVYATFWAPALWHRPAGALLALFGLAAFADALTSRIILDDEEIQIVGVMRKRRHARSEFESAKVDAGTVALKRKDGGWLVLPATGHNALRVRNTVHAWVRRGEGHPG